MVRTLSLVIATALVGVSAGSAFAQAGEVTAPDWLRRPTARDLNLVWPIEAMRRGVGGAATVSCSISAQGVLLDCKVDDESPNGAGFGAAAIALTPQFQMRPMTRDGRSVAGGTVRIPIRFVTNGAKLTPGAAVIDNIPWKSAPSFDDVLAVYPNRAREESVGGRVTLNCRYLDSGKLKDCKATGTTPATYGFAVAAGRLESLFIGPPLGEKLAGTDVKTQINVVFAPETLTGSRVIGTPKWTGVPTLEDVHANYPRAARAAGVTKARVALKCSVVDGGQLSGCAPQSEDPPSLGFGAAAVALSRSFRVSVWTGEGLPAVGGEVRVPVRFDLGDAPPP